MAVASALVFESKMMAENVEQLSKRGDVKEALEQTTGKPPVKAQATDKLWFVTHALLIIGCAIVSYLLARRFVPLPEATLLLAQRIIRGAILIILILALAKCVDVYAIGRITEAATRFTLKRVSRLIVSILVILIAISVLFVNWYTALISVGFISLILGLSVQAPMTSFIGWIYILVRRPYRVGDRIKIDDATGDVIDVGYIDTTLWEFGGQYLSTDHPSGRIIKFPNSQVLTKMVYNYSWPLFPYIWNEIKFNVAYESDLEFVARTMQSIAEEELGEAMLERIDVYRQLLAKTPVDELEVNERPRVIFRPNDNTWLDVILRYLVEPREAGRVKSQLMLKLLPALNAAPDKVLFPKSNAR